MKKFIFLLCNFAFISPSHVEDYYLGVGATASKYDVSINLGSFVNQTSTSKVGAKLFGGVVLDKNWSLEAAYVDLGDVSSDWAFSGRKGTAKLGVNAQYLAGKASFPMNENFGLFGKLGLARSKFSQSGVPTGGDETKSGVYAALGLDFAVSNNMAFTIAWEHLGSNSTYAKIKSGSLTAGLSLKF